MTLFYSRRAFSSRTGRFSNNHARLTRYLRITGSSSGVRHADRLGQDEWVQAVEAEAESDDVLIWVHGFNTDQIRMLDRTRQLGRDLKTKGYKGAVIAFDWASDGSLLRYAADRTDAKRAADAFVEDGIFPLQASGRRLRVHILAQSMGAYLVLRGFSGVGEPQGTAPWHVDQVLFTAADVNVKSMRSGVWGAVYMERRAERFTNYHNTKDSVLELSGVIKNIGTVRVGQRGLPAAKSSNAVDVRCTERYDIIRPSNPDATFSHNWYFEDDRFLSDLALTLSGRADSAMPDRLNASTGDRVLRP